MATLPNTASIIGNIKEYKNDAIRNALIAKQEVPAGVGLAKSQYHVLLKNGTVTVGAVTYTATPADLFFARSGVSDKRTCFNAVFGIGLPDTIQVSDKTVRVGNAVQGGTSNDIMS